MMKNSVIFSNQLSQICMHPCIMRISQSWDIIGYYIAMVTVQILLPIFCILTAAVLIALSVIAHFWYPYIDKEGNKRSKTKPEE